VREREAGARRRRRTPEAAQREIVEAAEALLRERPFRELTVDEVMRRTGLSRPSFYVYFKDRHELVLRVVAHLREELLAVASRWYEQIGGGPAVLREAQEGLVRVYGQHSAVLRALADAATDDPDVETAYGELIEEFVRVTAQHIEAEMRSGHVRGMDARETAKAMVWMTERYLYRSFAPSQRVSQTKVVDTLNAIWSRALYLSE
jgi:TetR/AcrR family transcriptional regulator, ethionamide resistance regulator